MGETPSQDVPTTENLRIEANPGYLEAHILGKYSLIGFRKQLAAIAEACRRREVGRLLLNFTGLRGVLRMADRYEIGSEGAALLKDLRVASYVRPDLVDPKRFAELVGRNRGLRVETFTDRKAALAWLLESKKSS